MIDPNKRYEALSPPWVIKWLKKHLLPFQNEKREVTTSEYKESSVMDQGERKREDRKKSRVLGEFKSIFPFMLFPDRLIVEEKRVVWINRMGPWLTKACSVMATDISNVEASHGPFFGHLHVGTGRLCKSPRFGRRNYSYC
jgi:hypothetical protein